MNYFRTPVSATSVTIRHSSRCATTMRDTGFDAFLNFVNTCKNFVSSRHAAREVGLRLRAVLALAVVCAASLYCASSASAQTTNGVVTAWGYNYYGECNIPDSAKSGVSAIAGGWSHTIALRRPVDTNNNNHLDSCEIADNAALDHNNNGVLDSYDCAQNLALDCNNNLQLDQYEIVDDPSLDCNGNIVIDSCDVDAGAFDDDGDGRPDACEMAKGDFDLDGFVDSKDLGILLLYWLEIDPPFGDFNHDRIIDSSDLGGLLGNFGPVTWGESATVTEHANKPRDQQMR